MSNVQSYNALIDRFKAFASGHFILKTFSHGQIDTADLEKFTEYPFMHVVPSNVTYAKGTKTFSFQIVLADLPRDKDDKVEFQREVLSDLQRIAEDLVAEITNHRVLFGDLITVQNVSLEPFLEEFHNTLTGWTVSLDLLVPYYWDACSIPAEWNDMFESGSGGTGSILTFIDSITRDENGNVSLVNDEAEPSPNYYYGTNDEGVRGWYLLTDEVGLTCETIGDCQTIIDIESAIDDLQTEILLKANTADISAVGFSNDYDDLDNKPTIPDVSGFVPYTGATQAVNLGAFDLTVNELTVGKGTNGLANNTALGHQALFHTTTGNYNTAAGHEAGHNLTTGQYNTALGQSAMFTATTASQNTAVGLNALLNTTSGGSNVAVGLDSLQHNTTGSSNTAVGYNAGSHITDGTTPNTTASNSIFIGRDTKAKVNGGANEIVIGQGAIGNGTNTATIGNSSITANYFNGSVNGGSFVKSGGTSSEFLKADGSVDSSTYVPTTRTLTINGTTQDLSANRTFTIATGLTVGTTPITSGAVGRILFEGTGNVLQQSANFFWDNTNSRLGIGTASPVVKYHQSQTQGIFARFDITNANADQNRGVWEFYTNTAVTPDFFGRFGFKFEGGVNNASKHFQIHVADNTNPRFIVNGSGNVLINTTTDAGFKLDVNGTARVSGNATFGTLGAGTGMFWDNTNNRLGIGTASPDRPLYINSAGTTGLRIDTTGTAGDGLYFGNSTALIRWAGGAYFNNKGMYSGTADQQYITFDGASTQVRLQIKASNGNVHIGTTTDVASSILTLASTTKGFLPPRMTNAQRLAIATPAVGLIVYCTDAVEGLYVNKSTGWTFVI